MTAVVRPLVIGLDEDNKGRSQRLADLRQQTLKVWEDCCRATGLHVSAEEADAWLAELEQGHDLEPPVCHA